MKNIVLEKKQRNVIHGVYEVSNLFRLRIMFIEAVVMSIIENDDSFKKVVGC